VTSSPALRKAFRACFVVNPPVKNVCSWRYLSTRGIEPIIQQQGYRLRIISTMCDITHLGSRHQGYPRTQIGVSRRCWDLQRFLTRSQKKILLREYEHAELHLRRPGGSYDPAENDDGEPPKARDMRKGMRGLTNGDLKKWSVKTTRSRGLRQGVDGATATAEDGLRRTKTTNRMWSLSITALVNLCCTTALYMGAHNRPLCYSELAHVERT
jgi:hypothetical protein